MGGFDAYTASDVLRGSGLSSSAAFEMGMAAIWNGEYGCGLAPAELAKICQYAENTYFGKPSGLLDQLTSAVGGIIFADFADPQQPVLEKIHADGLLPPGMSLCVTDTRGSHSELTGEFAAIRQEMEQIAAFLGKKVLGQVTESAFWAALPALRKACGDRAVLRAIHYFEENARTLAQRDALQAGQFDAFAALVLESGRASFALCQNVYCSTDVRHQGLSVALALSQSILQGSTGAWRMQGLCAKESAGTLSQRDRAGIRQGQLLHSASAGAGGSESDLKTKTHLQDFADAFFAMLYIAGKVQKTGFGPGAD